MNLTPPIPVLLVVTPSGTGTPVIGPLMAGGKIKALEESMQNIEAQLVAKSVELVGVIFASQAATKAWIKVEALANIVYIFLGPTFIYECGTCWRREQR
jgi:hypothetical protein